MWLLSKIILIIRIASWVIYAWLIWIPTRLTLIAIAGYFGLMYVLFGSVHVSEIKEIYGENNWGYFFEFFLPFAFPIFVAFLYALAQGKNLKGDTLHHAIRFRNSQIRVKPPKEDLMANTDSDVVKKAKRGFEAEYGNSSPTKVFKDIMDDDG